MPGVLIVLVRYCVPLEQSAVMQCLTQYFADNPSLRDHCCILVWDNSPQALAEPSLMTGSGLPFEYRHSGSNVGVSGAYNHAMDLAKQRSDTWLLLLDQDTTLPQGFLEAMLDYAARLEKEEQVAAVAPAVLMGSEVVSPKVTTRFGGSIDFPDGFREAASREVVLVNTGLLLRVAALERIGGFSLHFWLDFSDRYLCHMLAKHGFSVWIASELRLAHHISLMAGEGHMPEARYANLVAAEDAYFSLYKSFPRNVVYCQRLLRNAWRERKAHPERARLLLRHLTRRLTTSQARRIREWKQEIAAAKTR